GTIADIATDAHSTLGIVAGRIDVPAPDGSLSASLSQQGSMHDQLKEAGRALAQEFAAAHSYKLSTNSKRPREDGGQFMRLFIFEQYPILRQDRVRGEQTPQHHAEFIQ